ncbi:uncharacterized protein SETTUDRAFT_161464 [Exserohilum turcica Et28A]|uniref:Carboxylic ester hydrolase n=1 Tax=Exserohilum turcicum (strain 28A) TaxID=671987 RepID=R0KDL8_EXST2|nr:uncharacterized protein SETTUDRAFT_161464 [Exserohilum turcica Et28A]EOA86252.1 hypothetical protein SETTUDRAFT_161464 [Exserohilum turcica Et28A]
MLWFWSIDDAPTVTIASGVVIGTFTKPINQPDLAASANAYLGIPFAKSPPERFSPPEPAQPWSSPLKAQAIKPACIQQFSGKNRDKVMELFNNPLSDAPEESEDCLYVNVYTPTGVNSSSNKAVMFWIFGGNLEFGTGGLDYYDGSSLAINEDVVVVTFNYRTNIFGFSNSPEIAVGSQNSGYLDQRFALQWVQDNIASFGGDPTRVMLFGESAGGESVKQLLANPPNPRPFSSAILQSQQALSRSNGLTSYKKVLAKFNCNDIACLRLVPATEIKTYIESESLSFPPVNGDGTSVRDVRPSILTRKWARVPTLFGTTLNEARIFLAVQGLNTRTSNSTALAIAFEQLNLSANSTAHNNIFSIYATNGITNPYELADRILTDATFTCTTSALSNFLALNTYTTYRYQYAGVFPSASIFDNAGAYHSSENMQVFGTWAASNQFGNATDQQIKLSAFMQRTWAAFAKDPQAGVGWPAVGRAWGKELGMLGKGESEGVTVENRMTTDSVCGLYRGIGELSGLFW